MSPDKQKMMEDIHREYHRLWLLIDSMEQITNIDTALLDEARQRLMNFADCVERALESSEKPIMPPETWQEHALRNALGMVIR